jgi:hypothetical protein
MELDVPVSHVMADLTPHSAPLKWFLTNGLLPNQLGHHVELAIENGEWLFVEDLIQRNKFSTQDLLSMTQRLLSKELQKSLHSPQNLVLIDGLVPFIQNLKLDPDSAKKEVFLQFLVQTQKTRNGFVFRRLWYHILNTADKREIVSILQELKKLSVESFFENQISISRELQGKMESLNVLSHWESGRHIHISMQHF